MNVGFIGLGNMGFGMAVNIVKGGFTVNGYDLNPEALGRFKDQGGEVCKSAAEVAEKSDVVFIMTMNGQQAESVMFGENGVCGSLRSSGTVVICASCGTEYIKKIAAVMPAGQHLIDCPVTGGHHGANNGTLTLMVSGDKGVYNSIRSILETCSGKIYYCGEEVGDGQNAKSCVQAITGIEYIATAEVLALAVKVGLDPELVTDIILNSVAGSDMIKTVANFTMDRKFENTGANILAMYKDMGIVMDIARDYEMPMFLTSHANEYFRTAWARNKNEDCWAVVKVTEDLCGVEIKRKEV